MDVSGPRTMLALLVYGGVDSRTHQSLTRDAQWAAAGHAVATHRMQLRRAGVDISAVPGPDIGWPVTCHYPPGDALVQRCRAIVVEQFLNTSNEVLIFIDHDISWHPPTNETRDEHGKVLSVDYIGDILHLARKCVETRAIVGAAVSKRTKGEGIACLLKDHGQINIGSDELHECHYVGGAMTAYHRDALEAVAALFDPHEPGYRNIFDAQGPVPHPLKPGKMLHLSEDWAFCHHAAGLGIQSWLATMPRTLHHGQYAYGVVKDAAPPALSLEQWIDNLAQKYDAPRDDIVRKINAAFPPPMSVPSESATYPAVKKASKSTSAPTPEGQKHASVNAFEDVVYKNNAITDLLDRVGPTARPKISMIHATRGDYQKALGARARWLEAMTGDTDYEYIFSVDDDDDAWIDLLSTHSSGVIRGANRSCVDAYNRGSYASTGDILIQVQDDVTPPRGFDKSIIERLDITKEQILWVSDGHPEINAGNPDLIFMACGTRKFFKKLGGLFYPGYRNVFCDDDMGHAARTWAEVIVGWDLVFEHAWKGDRYGTAAAEFGEEMFVERRDNAFAPAPNLWGNLK